EINLRGNALPDHTLLRFNRLVGVYHQKIKFARHRQILLEDATLENAEALVRIVGQAKVHAGLEVFQLGPPIQDAAQRYVQAGLEEEGQVGQSSKIVNASHPFRRTTPHHVSGKCSEDVTVAQNQVTGAQQRDQLPLVTIRKISRMNQTEGCRAE